jgi:hypothetical protein
MEIEWERRMDQMGPFRIVVSKEEGKRTPRLVWGYFLQITFS